MLSEIINDAIYHDASDIQVIPEKNYARLFYRIDGSRKLVRELSEQEHKDILSLIKAAGSMDLTDNSRDQHGEYTHRYDGVSTQVCAQVLIDGSGREAITASFIRDPFLPIHS